MDRRSETGTRSNEQWLDELRADGRAGAEARSDLRTALMTGLSNAFRNTTGAEIEDFVQESMLRILARLDSFRGDSRFTTWATSIAVRVAWSELRRARWKDVSFEALVPIDEAMTEATTCDDPDRALMRARALALLDRALGQITERQRTVIAAELRGLAQDEIARRLGITRNAVYKLGHDARRAMLRLLVGGGFG